MSMEITNPTKKILGLRAVKAAFESVAEILDVYLNPFYKPVSEISRTPCAFIFDGDDEESTARNQMNMENLPLHVEVHYNDGADQQNVSEVLDFLYARIVQIVFTDKNIRKYFNKFAEKVTHRKEFFGERSGALVIEIEVEYIHPLNNPFPSN